jgi:hypothetical protein
MPFLCRWKGLRNQKENADSETLESAFSSPEVVVRPEGIEPPHPVPETGALSAELWAQVTN